MLGTLILLMSLGTSPGYPDNPVYRSYVDTHKKLFSLTGRYKIEDEGSLIIYSQPGYYKTANITFYYFSESLDSPIMRFKMKNLKKVLRDPGLLKRLKHIHKDLLKRDGDHFIINSIVANFGELTASR